MNRPENSTTTIDGAAGRAQGFSAGRASAGTASRQGRATKHHVIATAGTGVAAVGHELVRAEAHLPGILVERGRDLDRPTQVAAGWTFTSMTPGSG